MGAETRKKLGKLFALNPDKGVYKPYYDEFKAEIDAELNISKEEPVEEVHRGRPKKGA